VPSGVWRHEAALQCLSDSLHRTAGYSCQLFNISETFAGPRLSSWLHISSATRSIFCSVLTVLGRPLAAFQKIEFIVSILRRSLTELNAHFLLENSLQIRFASHPFSWQSNLIENLSSFTKWHVYQLWRNNDVTLITLHCVSCRVGSLHLLGSSYGILKNVETNFTHISQKWFYFSVHYTF